MIYKLNNKFHFLKYWAKAPGDPELFILRLKPEAIEKYICNL